MADQSTQETVSTQDAGAKRSFEAGEKSKRVRSDGGGRGARTGQKAPVRIDTQEVEWHFDIDDLGRVEGWLGEGLPGSGLVAGPGSSEDLVDRYYDTEDWRLYRAGYALRIRQKGGGAEAAMKSLAPSEGGLRRRREISEPLKDAKIGTLRAARGPVGERLRLLVGEREIGQIFEVRNNRKTFALNLADEEGGVTAGAAGSAAAGEIAQGASGQLREASGAGGGGKGTRVGEVVLDSAEIPLGEGEHDLAGLTRVEVEVADKAAFDPRVQGFVRQMEGSLGLRRASISKYEAGLFATGLSPEGWSDLGPTGVDASLSLGELAFAVLRRQFAAMRAHEPGTRLGEDPEELHDMRVATRRMRAAIKIFQDALPARSRWLREELRHFAGVLGAVRDLDVHIEEVKGLSSGDGEDEALAAVVASLEGRRAEARGRMLEALDSERYARFESSFAGMLRRGPYAVRTPEVAPTNGPSGASAASVPALEAAPGILGRLYSKWHKAARGLERGSHAEEFHDLRKKGKRLRYATEFFSGVFSEEATGALVGPLKAVQDSLGRHQDATVAAELLREIAIGTPRLPKRTVFAMGLLTQRYIAEAAGLRASSIAAEEYSVLVGGKAWKAFEKLTKKGRRAVGKPRKGGGRGKKKGR